MALPVFQAAGTGVGSITTISPAWPTHVADDIALLLIETSNEAVTLPTPAGFLEVTNQGTGTAGAAGGERLTMFWCRATSGAMGAPTTTDPGNHVYGVILTFRGCITTGNPWDVFAGDTSGASTSVSVPGATTTVAECLIAACCGRSTDIATAEFSAWANADLSSVAEQFDLGTIDGNGGGIGVATGEKATAGAYAATTATLASTAAHARISIALKPPLAAVSPRPLRVVTQAVNRAASF